MAVEKRRKENTSKIFGFRAATGIVAALALTVFFIHSLIPQSQIQKRIQVGPAPDGTFFLNTGWSLQPAGKNIPLSTLPMSTAASPDGRRMAVLNGGFLPASVDFLDMETTTKTASVSITDGWRGLAFSAGGTKLYAGNGAHASITEFGVKGDQLTVSRKIDLFPREPLQTLHLIADILPRDNDLLVADTLQDRIYEVNPAPTGAGPGSNGLMSGSMFFPARTFMQLRP
jgi:DNA-binding beta-propeller fold protein YncE